MVRVEVINQYSERHGKIGTISTEHWKQNRFWVPVKIDHQVQMVARCDLREVI